MLRTILQRRWAPAIVVLALLVPAGIAVAASSSVKLKGPRSVTVGTSFSFALSGFNTSGNDLQLFEVPGVKGGPQTCSSNDIGEGDRETAQHAYELNAWPLKRHKHFSEKESITTPIAIKPGKHTLCAYVVYSKLREPAKTLAHASAHYTVKS